MSTGKKSMVVKGTVAFSNLKEHETYQGQSTGRYSLVLVLDDNEAAKLEAEGVKIKDYKEKRQRKFASKFDVRIVDLNDDPVNHEIPYGSEVRALIALGEPHPVHGTATYLNQVRLVEEAMPQYDEEVMGEF